MPIFSFYWCSIAIWTVHFRYGNFLILNYEFLWVEGGPMFSENTDEAVTVAQISTVNFQCRDEMSSELWQVR